jgi:hypothetical protein
MGDYIRKIGRKLALSADRQTAYGTALTTSINASHPYEGNKIEKTLDKFTDEGQVGSGHEGSTYQKNKTSDTKGTLTFDGSSYILGLAFAFGNGKIVTTQPELTTMTSVHEITQMNIDDPAVGKQLPATTIVEQRAVGKQRKFRDMIVKSIQLSGKTDEQLKVQVEFQGSGHYESSNLTMPGFVQTSFLRFVDVQFNYGGTEISAELQDLTFKHTNELALKTGYHPGCPALNTTPGAPKCRGRCLVTKRTVELSFKMLIKTDTTIDEDELSNEVKSITISAEGETIEGTYKHKMLLEFPSCAVKATKDTDEEDLEAYDVEMTIHWDDTIDGFYKATITNNVPSYLAPGT